MNEVRAYLVSALAGRLMSQAVLMRGYGLSQDDLSAYALEFGAPVLQVSYAGKLEFYFDMDQVFGATEEKFQDSLCAFTFTNLINRQVEWADVVPPAIAHLRSLDLTELLIEDELILQYHTNKTQLRKHLWSGTLEGVRFRYTRYDCDRHCYNHHYYSFVERKSAKAVLTPRKN